MADETERNTAQPSHDQTQSNLWEANAFGDPYQMPLTSTQSTSASMYAMTTQSYLVHDPLPAVSDHYGMQGRDLVSSYFTGSHPSDLGGMADNASAFQYMTPSFDTPQVGYTPAPLTPTYGQPSMRPAAAPMDNSPSRRRTTCPVCYETKGSARDLDRHLWTHHRDYAAEHQVRSEERQCPHPHCPYVGRKDNLSRHIKARHRGLTS